MKKIIFLVMLLWVGVPCPSEAYNTVYQVCNGNNVDDYIDIYFTAHASTNINDFQVRSGYQYTPMMYLGATDDHFWLEGRTDHTGQGYVFLGTATNATITMANMVCQPHTSPIGAALTMFNNNITIYVWFFAGVLAAVVVIMGIA